MKKLVFQAGGIPMHLNHWDFSMNGIIEVLSALVKVWTQNRTLKAYRLYGATHSVSGNNYNISEGWVVLNDEVYYVPAHSVTIADQSPAVNYWYPVVDHDPLGTVNLLDGGTGNIYHIRTAQLLIGDAQDLTSPNTYEFDGDLPLLSSLIAEDVSEEDVLINNLSLALPSNGNFLNLMANFLPLNTYWKFRAESVLSNSGFAQNLAALSHQQTVNSLSQKTNATLSFLNGWSGNINTDFVWRKDFLGNVILSGELRNSAFNNQTKAKICNLPSGFLPIGLQSASTEIQFFDTSTGNSLGVGTLRVNSNGLTAVTPNTPLITGDVTIYFSMIYVA